MPELSLSDYPCGTVLQHNSADVLLRHTGQRSPSPYGMDLDLLEFAISAWQTTDAAIWVLIASLVLRTNASKPDVTSFNQHGGVFNGSAGSTGFRLAA